MTDIDLDEEPKKVNEYLHFSCFICLFEHQITRD